MESPLPPTQLQELKSWLATGSLNLFGLPMSGKDTVGQRLAELLGAKFLSSGLIIRQAEKARAEDLTSSGALIPTNQFYDLILPYFGHPDLAGVPLVLSSVGRWSGEEVEVMAAARRHGHPIRAAILLEITPAEAETRRQAALRSGDRGLRADDTTEAVFAKRLQEFQEKTLPVLDAYARANLLIKVNGEQPRPAVLAATLQALHRFSREH